MMKTFSWKERSVCFQDRFWHVPDYTETERFIFPGWEDAAWFGNQHPVNVEFCSGNGSWISERARAFPNENWVAIEKQFDRARKIWRHINRYSLNNLIVVCGDGRVVVSKYFKTNSINKIFINFPDPWPKKKHAKHRLIQPQFIQEAARILAEGEMMLVTDDVNTSQLMIQEVLKSQLFTPFYPEPYFVHEFEAYGTSFFEELFRSQGKLIHYHRFTPCLSKKC